MHSGFAARVSRRVPARSRSKRQHRKVQWLARTRECTYIFWLQPLLLGETLGKMTHQEFPKLAPPIRPLPTAETIFAKQHLLHIVNRFHHFLSATGNRKLKCFRQAL